MKRSSFICHSSTDSREAMQLALALEARRETCWIAPRDIDAGASYPHEIMEGIRNCNTFIILLTQAAAGSPHILRELETAVNLRKRLVPLRFEGVKPGNAIEYLTASVQWIDISLEEMRLSPGLVAERILEGGSRSRGAGGRPAARNFLPLFLLLLLCAVFVAGYLMFSDFKRDEVKPVALVESKENKEPLRVFITRKEEAPVPEAPEVEIPAAVVPSPHGKWVFTVKSAYVIGWDMEFGDGPEAGTKTEATGTKVEVNGIRANFTERKTTLQMTGEMDGREWKGNYLEKAAKKTFSGNFAITFSEDMTSFQGTLLDPDGKESAKFVGRQAE